MRSTAPLALALFLSTVASAQTPDAGPNLTTFHPAAVRLQGSLQGGTPLVWYSADGNIPIENHVVRSSSATGVTSVKMTDGNSAYGWPSDFARINGVVWGSDVAKDQLYKVDVLTGLVTPVGAKYPMYLEQIEALAYDENLGKLFAIDLQLRQLMTLDLSSAFPIFVGSQTLLPYALIRGLAWRPSDQQLYAIDQALSLLLRIDPTNGNATVLHTLPASPGERYDSLAWVNDELYVNNSILGPGVVQLFKVDLSDGSMDAVSDIVPTAGGHALLIDSVQEPVLWSQISGPGSATFSDATVARPLVSFSAPGAYVLELVVTTPSGPVADRTVVFSDPGTGTVFCFGDGSGNPCPCGNSGAAGAGCVNETGLGAVLANQGGISAGADDALLVTIQMPANVFGIYFMGFNTFNAGFGLPFANGLACAAPPSYRFPGFLTTQAGEAVLAQPGAQFPAAIQPGVSFIFQAWYRDVTGPCGQPSNLSNGLAITFQP